MSVVSSTRSCLTRGLRASGVPLEAVDEDRPARAQGVVLADRKALDAAGRVHAQPHEVAEARVAQGGEALVVLERAEDPTDRASVIEAMFATEDRDSILGTYSIDENGDTTLTDYGVFTIDGGDLVFDQKISTE